MTTKKPPVVEQASGTPPRAASAAEETPAATTSATFAPAKIGILPLTELSRPAGANQAGKLTIFVTMLDAFGCQMKAPGVLRFELYEYVPRSAQQKGPRLTLWPDIDLTAAAENHKYWRDFLRAYEFELDTQATRDKTYVLEATCQTSDNRRLSCDYTLRGTP